MRRINNINRVLELLRDVHPLTLELESFTDSSLDVICPNWPSFINGLLSSRLHVSVYPFSNCRVKVCICVS